MARDFSSGDNVITYSSVALGGLARSYGGWYWIDTIDGTDRRFWEWGSTLANQNGNPRFNSTRVAITIGEVSNNYGGWNTTTLPATGQWVHIMFTFAGTDTDNVLIYYDGVSQTVVEDTTPSGTMANSTTDILLGNRAAGDRPFDGKMAEWAHWNRVLSQDEITLLAAGYAPTFLRNGLKRYIPIIGNLSDEPDFAQGATGSITGTASKATHPPIIYPVKPYVNSFAAAVAANTRRYSLTTLGVG